MRMLRITCCAMIMLLLLQGGGVVSALHKITHHAQTQSVTSCEHGSAEHAPVPDDGPSPEQGDDDCSICLGLSGLHLAPVADAPRVCDTPEFVVARVVSIWTPVACREMGEHPARAPPVC